MAPTAPAPTTYNTKVYVAADNGVRGLGDTPQKHPRHPAETPTETPKKPRRPPIETPQLPANRNCHADLSVYAWEKPAPEPPEAEKEKQDLGEKGLFGFMDPQTVKDQVKMALEKHEPYSVFQYYKESGIWVDIAKSPVFENVTLGVISINAAYIALDTDWNKEEPLTPTNTYSLTESHAFFQFMEHSFCVYFFFEWTCRFMAFKIKSNGLKDGWFVFDSVLVFMMVMETWVMTIIMAAMGGGANPVGGTSILRLFRLLRLSRLLRMLRSLPELMILIKGMVTAMKSVAYVMALLVLITYVFAIAFTQLAVGTEVGDDLFANIAHSMYSLLIYATLLDDLIDFTDALRLEMWVLLVLAFIYISLAALTVMNMLIGVLCEVVSAVAESERDDIRTETLTHKMREVVEALDKDKNNKLSYKEFGEIMGKPDALTALEDVGVSPVGIVDFAELFFFEDGKPVDLTFEAFMEVILELRETNQATVKDMLHVWMKIKQTTNKDIKDTQRAADKLSEAWKEKAFSISGRMDKLTGNVEGMSNMMKVVSTKYS
jgi:hypothetical protein